MQGIQAINDADGNLAVLTIDLYNLDPTLDHWLQACSNGCSNRQSKKNAPTTGRLLMRH